MKAYWNRQLLEWKKTVKKRNIFSFIFLTNTNSFQEMFMWFFKWVERIHMNKPVYFINASRNKFQYQQVIDASGNPRRMKSTVKDLLHTNHDRGDGSRSTEEVTTFCSKFATFFIKKATKIKSGISSTLAGLRLVGIWLDDVIPPDTKVIQVIRPAQQRLVRCVGRRTWSITRIISWSTVILSVHCATVHCVSVVRFNSSPVRRRFVDLRFSVEERIDG
jgi:hypothetical protein